MTLISINDLPAIFWYGLPILDLNLWLLPPARMIKQKLIV